MFRDDREESRDINFTLRCSDKQADQRDNIYALLADFPFHLTWLIEHFQVLLEVGEQTLVEATVELVFHRLLAASKRKALEERWCFRFVSL